MWTSMSFMWIWGSVCCVICSVWGSCILVLLVGIWSVFDDGVSVLLIGISSIGALCVVGEIIIIFDYLVVVVVDLYWTRKLYFIAVERCIVYIWYWIGISFVWEDRISWIMICCMLCYVLCIVHCNQSVIAWWRMCKQWWVGIYVVR